jgi:hypothetical protein
VVELEQPVYWKGGKIKEKKRGGYGGARERERFGQLPEEGDDKVILFDGICG